MRVFPLILCSTLLFCAAMPAFAQTDSRGFEIDPNFNPDLVLNDEDIFSVEGISKTQLNQFLSSKGALGSYTAPDIDGEIKSAADIIWHMSTTYQINPKYLVALLQKEQSLVEDPDPTQRQFDWATGFGVCDNCSKDDPSIQDFKGFANQLYYAARQMREKYYLRILTQGATISGYAPGKTVTIDGLSVTPVNIATASLYSYTPHIHGNQSLWNIWRRWFSKNFPDGSVVQGTPSGTIYQIKFGQRRPFASLAVASSLVNLNQVIQASDTDLSTYEEGPAIKFPNYSLIKDPSGRIWLIVGNMRRHIDSMETFRKFGFLEEEVEDALDQDLQNYEIGNEITLNSMYPQGRLVQAKGAKDIWYAENGKKQLVAYPALLSLYFGGERPQIIPEETLNQLETVEPYTLHDGELVKAPDESAVYVIEHRLKRLIPTGEIFESMGWKWKNVHTIPKTMLTDYEDGQPIQVTASSN
jgi:hypothetical protein